MTRAWRADEDRSGHGVETAVFRMIEQALDMEQRAAQYLGQAERAEWEAQRAVERGNTARASAVGARKQAVRLRRQAESLSRRITRERDEE